MKKILLVTRPITPPWDEASKNFAYTLARKITSLKLGMLTCGYVSSLPKNVNQHPIYTSNSFSYLQKIRLVKNLRKIRKDYDILHYLFTPTKANSFLLKNFLTPKKNSRSIQTIATLREDLYEAKEIKNLIFGDLIITYSDYAKTRLNSLGFKNVKRVYPGIDLALYHPAPKDPNLLKLLNLNSNDFIITYPGEYTRLGFTDNLVQFIIKYHQELRKNKIVIIFPGREKNQQDTNKRKELTQLFKQRQLLDLVRFPVPPLRKVIKELDHMQKMYNLSDLILFPVHNMHGKFDIPLAVVEAMACEKPVIISDLPILNELAKNDNSVIIEKADLESLHKAILDLYENKSKRKIIGEKAKKFVSENFDIQKIAQIYQQIYEKL
jgi:glycosyltransferase involved in cell wall biosynthesis